MSSLLRHAGVRWHCCFYYLHFSLSVFLSSTDRSHFSLCYVRSGNSASEVFSMLNAVIRQFGRPLAANEFPALLEGKRSKGYSVQHHARHSRPKTVPAVAADGEDSNANMCTLCMDRSASVRLLPCHHDRFCLSCITVLENKLCPLCRDPFLTFVRI